MEDCRRYVGGLERLNAVVVHLERTHDGGRLLHGLVRLLARILLRGALRCVSAPRLVLALGRVAARHRRLPGMRGWRGALLATRGDVLLRLLEFLTRSLLTATTRPPHRAPPTWLRRPGACDSSSSFFKYITADGPCAEP